MISTRGRYALRVMVDLAEHSDTPSYVPMKAVAERQELSLKYLERILPSLTSAGLIEGVQGKGGGYKLTREPSEYNAFEIVDAAEITIATVACLEPGAEYCSRSSFCKTLPLWKNLNTIIEKYLKSITLEDFMLGRNLELPELPF